MDNKQVLTAHVRRLAQALVKAGVTAAVVSPGSRSTPLAYAFATSENLSFYMQVDERSAAYFALGLAKASGRPVALLCTSGTAASNYHPAITEAYYARIPLVVLTADRPHELREVGAPQAIDQIRMYGEHVKYSVDLPLAEDNPLIDDYIDRHVQRALSTALTVPAGPVHLNLPFREPLMIDFDQTAPNTTFVQQISSKLVLDKTAVRLTEGLLNSAERGLIIAGEMPVDIDKSKFWTFAKSLNWPVLCDPLSNLRSEVPPDCEILCIDQYDALLKSSFFMEKAKPDTVIRFGAQPVSKPLMLYLKNSRPENLIIVDESPAFRDPLGVATHHIQSSPEAVWALSVQKEKTAYTELWSQANESAAAVLDSYHGAADDEGYYAKLLFEQLPDQCDLVTSSSMPIRDADTFFRKTSKDIRIFANRGANGIDGVVSTALGITEARKRPAYLLIGDLSFLHDVNGLIATRFHDIELTIIIFNNDGGGIFSYLPQSAEERHFEQLFGTPTGLVFSHIAAMYDAQYSSVHTPEEFTKELRSKKERPIRIIEVFTDRHSNVQAHRNLWAQMAERIKQDD